MYMQTKKERKKMCLIIYKPAKKQFDLDLLETAWKMNPHGGGYMYSENNKLCIEKGYFNKNAFAKDLLTLEEKDIVVHFRYSTAGKINLNNCHPFDIGKNVGMVHNGTISDIKITNKEMSDTWHFAKEMKKLSDSLGDDFFMQEEISECLKKIIGKTNKLVFMNNTGKINIINDEEGTYLDGIWYSNLRFIVGRDGMNNLTMKNFVKKMGKIIRPYKLSNEMIREGNEWFYCDGCDKVFDKEVKNEKIINQHKCLGSYNNDLTLCNKCNTDLLWTLEKEYVFNDLILNKNDVQNVYEEEMEKIKQEMLREQKEKNKKLFSKNKKEVVLWR